MNIPANMSPEAMEQGKAIYDSIIDRAAEYISSLGLPHDAVLRLSEIAFHFRDPEAEIDRVTARNLIDVHERGFLEIEVANTRVRPPELAIYSVEADGVVHPIIPNQTFGLRFFSSPEFYIAQLDGAHLEAKLR